MDARLQIREATPADIPAIQKVADSVFRHTYADIITPSQMEYMLDWMYSEESLLNQITADGKHFFLAELPSPQPSPQPASTEELVGYVTVEFEKTLEDGAPLYHLQKIYVHQSMQGHGFGEIMFRHVTDFLKTQSPEGFRMELNVNRNNKAVGFYEHMGMVRDREGDFDIGDGFYMNDYIYALDYRR